MRQAVGSAALVATMALSAPAALALRPAARAGGPAGPLAGAAELGAAPGAQQLPLALSLRADESGLRRFATAVSTPGSPQYGQYDSIANLAHRFGASAADRARVLHYFTSVGARGAKIDATGLFVHVTMSVSLAQQLFGTSLARFRTARATRFIAPTQTARLPPALGRSVTGVVGLDTRPLLTPAPQEASGRARSFHAASPSSSSPTAVGPANFPSGYPARTGTAVGCRAVKNQPGFTPNQYLTAYNYAPLRMAGIGGQGERVALIEIDGFRYSDLRTFAKCFDLPTPAIDTFGVGHVKHLLAPRFGEAELDLEILNAAAPDLKAVDVYETAGSTLDILDSLTAPLQNPGNKPDVISVSLGECERDTVGALGGAALRAIEGSLALADASGISVLASSGDQGSSSCLTGQGQPLPELAVDYPASSPWVTGVGGTNFTLDRANQITSQSVWNDAPFDSGAAGGGVSALFARPGYQNGFAALAHREVPDVSMLADPAPGYEYFCTAKEACLSKGNRSPWASIGGTSAASPLLAGGLALVDQVLRTHGLQDLGLANPLLYAIDRLPAGAAALSDVTSNDNDLGSRLIGRSLGCCTAVAGYDDASGLGSVNIAALALVASTLVPKVVSVGVSLPGQRPLARRHLVARVSCSGRCLMGAFSNIELGRSRRTIAVYSSEFLLRAEGARTIKLVFSQTQLSRLRSAQRHRERITATVYGVILDPGGNIERRSRGMQLTIRR